MKRSAKFFQRVLALACLLLSFLILDAALLGILPVIGAVALLPLALLVTGRLFVLSLRPARRRAPAGRHSPTHRPPTAKGRRQFRVFRREAPARHNTHAA